MITREDLVRSGYKPFTQRGLKTYTNSFYQKCMQDEGGKRFYVTVAEYDNRDYQGRIDGLPDFSYSPETQFEAHGQTFDIQLHKPESIEQMEAFFEKMWMAMDCDYYESYERYVE